jgi:iron(III) transport system permease protein
VDSRRHAAPLGLSGWGLNAAVAVIAALFAAPFAYLVVRSFIGEGGRLLDTVTTPDALGALGRSLLLGLSVALAATIVGTACAWIVARTDIGGVRLWRLLLPLPLVIPSYIGAFVLLAAFAPGGLFHPMLEPLGLVRVDFEGFSGAFIALTLFTFPYVYLPTHARLQQLPPSLEESARLLGRGPWRTFFGVVLPQIRPAVLAGSLLVFLYTISEFGVVQLMRYDTLPRVIYSTRLLDATTSVRLSLMLGVLALAVVASERLVVRGAPIRATRAGRRALHTQLGKWRPVALAFVSGVVGLALAVPVLVLVWWALRGLLGGSQSPAAFVTDLSGLLWPALNTSLASVSAAIIAIALVLPIAYLRIRRPGGIGGIANAIVVAGFALPGLAIALALVFVTLGSPGPLSALYQTLPLLIVAYVVHFGAQAMRATQVAVTSVPARLDDAARTLGARRLDRLLRVELPLMFPGLLAGGGLVLLSSMKELPATLLLAPTGFQTLSMRIWSGTESALFADASLASLFLIVTSGVLTWLLVIRRSQNLV